MSRQITIKDLEDDEELFDCVLRKIGFFYFLNNPDEYTRLNNLSLKKLGKPLEYQIPIKKQKYRVIIVK